MGFGMVTVIGGKNPEIMLSLLATRNGWKIDPLKQDTFRLSKGPHVLIIYAPAIKAGHEITCIYSPLTSKKNTVVSHVIGENLSHRQVAEMIDTMIKEAMAAEKTAA